MTTYFFCVFLTLILGGFIRIYRKTKQKQLGNISFNKVVESDMEFVLFLRSFQDDGKRKPLGISLFTLTHQLPTIEKQVVRDFKEFNVIAVGKPGDESLPLGAKRMYLDKEQWKSCVDVLINRASFIIVKPSFSEGLNWELETIFSKKLMSKTILYHMFSNLDDKKAQKKYYNEFSKIMKKKFSVDLEEFSTNNSYSYFQDDLTHKPVRNKNQIPFVKK